MPYFDIDKMYDSGMRASDIPQDTREEPNESKLRPEKRRAAPSKRQAFTMPKRRPDESALIPPTDREFDELYFENQGNPYEINPLVETAKASIGREQLFEDMFYISYSERESLNEDDKKQWEATKKSYDKNIYGNAKERKSQAVKQYTMLKGYNTDQRAKYNKNLKEEKARTKRMADEREAIEKELYMLEKEGARLGEGGEYGIDKPELMKVIKKRRKTLQGQLGQTRPAKQQQIVETRVWKGRTVNKMADGSIVFADAKKK